MKVAAKQAREERIIPQETSNTRREAYRRFLGSLGEVEAALLVAERQEDSSEQSGKINSRT